MPRHARGSVRRHRALWQASVQVDGRRLWKSFEEKGDAWRWIATVKADSVRGTLQAPSKGPKPIRLADLARLLIVTRTSPSARRPWREGTARYYRGHCKTSIFPKWGNRWADDITADEIQEWLDEQARRVSASTARKYYQVLSAIFTHGLLIRRLKHSPMEHVECHAQPPEPESFRVLRPHELRAILDAAQGPARALLCLAGLAGLRKSEIARMRWGWADFDGGMLRVRIAKRGSSELPMSARLRTELLALRPAADTDLVFPGFSRAVGPRTRDPHKEQADFRRPLAVSVAAAGIAPEGISMHTLRRTFATLLELLPGVSYGVVRALMRHSRKSGGDVTARYLRPPLEDQRRALAQLEELVFGLTKVVSIGSPSGRRRTSEK